MQQWLSMFLLHKSYGIWKNNKWNSTELNMVNVAATTCRHFWATKVGIVEIRETVKIFPHYIYEYYKTINRLPQTVWTLHAIEFWNTVRIFLNLYQIPISVMVFCASRCSIFPFLAISLDFVKRVTVSFYEMFWKLRVLPKPVALYQRKFIQILC